MGTFYDDFERADGPLGDDWIVSNGNPAIQSGYVDGHPGWSAKPADFTAAGYVSVSSSLKVFGMGGPNGYVAVKCAVNGGNGYYVNRLWDGVHITFRLYKAVGGFGTVLGSMYVTAASGADCPVTLEYNNGHIRATMYGTNVLEADDNTYAAQAYVFMGSSDWQVGFNDFGATNEEPPYLTITPAQVWFANPIIFLQAELHNAVWTPTPPTGTQLDVDKGYVAATHFESATIAAFEWAALLNQGTVTVTDPITGATGTFLSTLYPPQDSGQSYPLTEEGGGILNRTGDACPEGTILTTCDEPDLGGKLTQIRLALNGTLDLDPEEVTQGYPDSLGGMLSQMLDLWNTDTPGTRYTVQDVLNFLAGSPVGYSHKDIIDALPPFDSVSNQDVIDAVHAAQGDGLPTIKNAFDALQTISTIAGYTLGDVLDAIGAIEPADLSSVITAISNLRGGTATVQDAYDQASTAVTLATSIDTSLGQVRTQAQLTLQDVLDAIAAIPAPEPAAYGGPPVWPGEDNVTYGTPILLSSQAHIFEPCDGVKFEYTTLPHRTGQYNIGGSIYYYGCGWIAFETEEGYIEPWQYLGFDNAIFTCKSMRRAGGFRATILAGGEAIVTPWVKSES